jgi:hypothetical protein
VPKSDVVVGFGGIVSWVNYNLRNTDLSTTGSPVLLLVNIWPLPEGYIELGRPERVCYLPPAGTGEG